jgi:hypothetical protein
MVEERSLSDAELDAALSEAFAVDPSPDFVVRIRRRVANEPSADRHVRFFTVAATVCAVTAVFAVLTLERTPVVEQRPVPVAKTNDRVAATPPDAPVVAVRNQPAAAPARRQAGSRLRATPAERRTAPEAPDVLIPASEQQALRRLFKRPPIEVLQFAPDKGDAVVVSEITVPLINIDPLSHDVQEGGHQ